MLLSFEVQKMGCVSSIVSIKAEASSVQTYFSRL